MALQTVTTRHARATACGAWPASPLQISAWPRGQFSVWKRGELSVWPREQLSVWKRGQLSVWKREAWRQRLADARGCGRGWHSARRSWWRSADALPERHPSRRSGWHSAGHFYSRSGPYWRSEWR